MAFAHLHTHTEYSLLDGAIRIKEVVQKAKEYGMTVLVTDHHEVPFEETENGDSYIFRADDGTFEIYFLPEENDGEGTISIRLVNAPEQDEEHMVQIYYVAKQYIIDEDDIPETIARVEEERNKACSTFQQTTFADTGCSCNLL